jgi:hypothetical protein
MPIEANAEEMTKSRLFKVTVPEGDATNDTAAIFQGKSVMATHSLARDDAW